MNSAWDISEKAIQSKLAQAQDHIAEEAYISAFLSDAPKPAAVLVPLLRARIDETWKEEWHILLTRRSDRLAEHRGQVAFPGGRCDPGDITPEATALREAQEEIGLPPSEVRILGRLNNMWTITNYSITPVVAVIPWPFPIRLAELEVSRVFTIPINWLADPTHHEIRQREIPSQYSLDVRNERHPIIYFNPYKGEVLWGVSAEITNALIRILRE